jgi:hypothetical protein
MYMCMDIVQCMNIAGFPLIWKSGIVREICEPGEVREKSWKFQVFEQKSGKLVSAKIPAF